MNGMKRFLLSITLSTAFCASAALAETCESLAHRIGAAYGIPDGILAAIARKESGYSPSGGAPRAWPWTTNEAGKSSYFATRDQAEAHLASVLARGDTNIDIGCMQINYRWHSEAFDTPAEMFEPVANVDYAAKFLTVLHEKLGSWPLAIGHYHSSSAELGPQYAASVLSLVDDVGRASLGGEEFEVTQVNSAQSRGFLARNSALPLIIRKNVDRMLAAGVRRPRARPLCCDSFQLVTAFENLELPHNLRSKAEEVTYFRHFFDSIR